VRALDLFCGAGGASMGLFRAGYEVYGVDQDPQPHYPFNFTQGDALTHPLEGYDLIWASPPCQLFTAYRRKGHGVGKGYPDLIDPVRKRLQGSGAEWVIENVSGAPLNNPTTLCGSMFGLDVRRHRLFEASFAVPQLECDHASQAAKGKRFPGATNRTGRYTCEVGVWRIPLATQQEAMGIDWMPLKSLTEAIPPAYSEYIARAAERCMT
jgi:DNA (cytosine-5)-methyltransferase 1